MSLARSNQTVLALLVLSGLLLGLSIFLIGEHRHISLITDFYGISDILSGSIFNAISAISFLAIALLAALSFKHEQFLKWLGVLLIVVGIVPLLSLFGSSMWIDSLGGFPAIGSGQGIIKYAALVSIGLYFINPQQSNFTLRVIQLIPVTLVLLWIGGMKFTLLEAKGIEDLVKSSPLMSWMYQVWDLQMTSNLIGVYDLIAVALLVLSLFYKQLLWIAIVMSGAVFLTTQTFLFTWDAALSGETILSTGGYFLIKDLWYIANLAIFAYLSKK